MTEKKRILLNIFVTYGRSLYALMIGLFCGRWTLMILGEIDYGLMGLIGGLTAFVAFFNGIMSAGVGRFYAVTIGEARNDPEEGLVKCRKWFTTAVAVHTILPVALVAAGYPAGVWTIENFLAIPADRMGACIWVWRYCCASCFIGMVGVPYRAMYGAKQEIAEITLYSVLSTTVNVCFLYFALLHPGDWLAALAAWQCALASVVAVVICLRATWRYRECRVIWMTPGEVFSKIKTMLSYSGWLVFVNLAHMLSQQGMGILINRNFGAKMNAAQAVGNTVSGHCSTLSANIHGAFAPAVMTAYGEGRMDRVRRGARIVSRLGSVFILVFAVPLALEINEVLLLWLKNPPAYAALFCICGLMYAFFDHVSAGYVVVAHATGNVRMYQICIGGIIFMALPVAAGILWLGGGIVAMMASFMAIRFIVAVARVFLVKRLIDGISVRYWTLRIMFPLFAVMAASYCVGTLPRMILAPSFMRVCVTTLVSLAVVLPLSWFTVFSDDERNEVKSRLSAAFRRMSRK